MQPSEIVDILGDIFDPAVQETIRRKSPRLILCGNMLEHVPADRRKHLADVISDVLVSGGYAIVTAPRSYPYHPDPIDTYYRPTTKELSDLFPSLSVVAAAELTANTYWQELRANKFRDVPRAIARLIKPFRKFDRWKETVHRFFWLNREYTQSCVVLLKP